MSAQALTAAVPAPAQTKVQTLTKAHLASAVAGVALEVYDFTVYTYFAVAIGHAFFTAASAFESLMLSLGVFGVGFLSRPIGGLVLGAYADRAGRRKAMVVSFLLAGLSILAVALTPGYAQIGLAAPLIVTAARLVQGFALGGELGATTSFLLEAAPSGQRGRYAALQYVGQGAAAVAAGVVGVALSLLLSRQQLDAYGWRIAFFLGALVMPLGLAIRRSLPETLDKAVAEEGHAPRAEVGLGKIVVLGLLMIGSGTIGNYLFHYMTTFATTVLHMSSSVALAIPAVTGFCILVSGLAGGALSDRIGRRPVMIWPAALGLLATYPVFSLIVRQASAATLWGGLALLSLLGGLSAGASIVALTEALPPHRRSAGLSLVYAVAVAVFGGTTQMMATWLIKLTGDPMAAAWYVLAATAVGLVARMAMPETAPVKLRAKA